MPFRTTRRRLGSRVRGEYDIRLLTCKEIALLLESKDGSIVTSRRLRSLAPPTMPAYSVAKQGVIIHQRGGQGDGQHSDGERDLPRRPLQEFCRSSTKTSPNQPRFKGMKPSRVCDKSVGEIVSMKCEQSRKTRRRRRVMASTKPIHQRQALWWMAARHVLKDARGFEFQRSTRRVARKCGVAGAQRPDDARAIVRGVAGGQGRVIAGAAGRRRGTPRLRGMDWPVSSAAGAPPSSIVHSLHGDARRSRRSLSTAAGGPDRAHPHEARTPAQQKRSSTHLTEDEMWCQGFRAQTRERTSQSPDARGA